MQPLQIYNNFHERCSPTMTPNWRDYEDYVYETLRAKYPQHIFKRDGQMVGKAGTKRQVDIAIYEKIAGHEILTVVDCKYYEKKIDVKNVEMFIGMLEDLGADVGIMVTATGYTSTAKTRAKISRVRLDIVKYEDIDEYELDFYICDECFDDEHMPGIVDWHNQTSLDGDVDKVFDVGRCDRCTSLYIRCLKCRSITPIPEYLYDQEVECDGGCQTHFLVTNTHDRSGGPTESIIVKSRGK